MSYHTHTYSIHLSIPFLNTPTFVNLAVLLLVREATGATATLAIVEHASLASWVVGCPPLKCRAETGPQEGRQAGG